MNIKQRSTLSNRFYQIGYFLVVFLFAIVAVSTLFFAIGIPILRANVVIAFLVTCFWMHKEYPDDSDVIKMIGIALAIICICALIATYVYDFSFDGNTYHKSTVGMLRYGWNPIYQSFGSAALRNKIIPEYDWPVWYDHYPKASWIIGAAFYAISGNIETGKCFNNILIISAALLIVSELLKRSRMGMPKCIVIGLIAVLNPITIAQSQSYYNDGAMQMLIFITMVALIEWTFDRKCRYGKTLIFCTINLALNIKFSGIIFMGIYCGAFFIWWVLRDYRVNKNIKTCWQYIRFYCITLLVTFGFTGSTSYGFGVQKSSIALLLAYFCTNLSYSLGLKNVPFVDVCLLVAGFLLRVVYGATLINASVSSWVYLTVLSLSFYLGLGKRRNELKKVGNGKSRKVLKYYTAEFLDRFMYVCLTLSIVFYALWSTDGQIITKYGTEKLIWTVPLVIVLLMKYSADVESDSYGDPVDVITKDYVLLGLSVLFCIMLCLIVYHPAFL